MMNIVYSFALLLPLALSASDLADTSSPSPFEQSRQEQVMDEGMVKHELMEKQGPPPQKKLVGVFYVKRPYLNLHQGTLPYSSVLTTLSCNQPVKVFETTPKIVEDWQSVTVGDFEGFLPSEFLGTKRANCFNEKYPKFLNSLQLDLTEMYYWGRLDDQYIQGKSQIR